MHIPGFDKLTYQSVSRATAHAKTTIIRLLHPTHLGVYILLAAVIWSIAYYQAKLVSTRGSISVTGVAYENVRSDKGQWTIEIERNDADRRVSYEQVTRDEKRVRAFLSEKGVLGAGPSNYDTQEVYRKNTNTYGESNEIEGYRSTARFGVTSTNVDNLYEAQSQIHPFLIESDITLSQNEVEFYFTDLENLKITLLEKAIGNARERAGAIGKHAQSAVGKIISANQGIFQVNRAGDLSVSDYGNYDTSSIDKTIRALVTVEFSVQ